jgi:hypothetical protein
MKVVRHQAVRQAVPAELLDDTTQQPQIALTIVFVEKDPPPFNAASEHMPDVGLGLIAW